MVMDIGRNSFGWNIFTLIDHIIIVYVQSSISLYSHHFSTESTHILWHKQATKWNAIINNITVLGHI